MSSPNKITLQEATQLAAVCASSVRKITVVDVFGNLTAQLRKSILQVVKSLAELRKAILQYIKSTAEVRESISQLLPPPAQTVKSPAEVLPVVEQSVPMLSQLAPLVSKTVPPDFKIMKVIENLFLMVLTSLNH